MMVFVVFSWWERAGALQKGLWVLGGPKTGNTERLAIDLELSPFSGSFTISTSMTKTFSVMDVRGNILIGGIMPLLLGH